ncbi:MAG: hypothetical protein HC851_02195 [Acaryochloris sp. RU_4_1]|nr:hypothetical protein [Acaryochloris sp. RU_4_1]
MTCENDKQQVIEESFLNLFDSLASRIIGIGRILTNPPSRTTHPAGPQWAVPNLPARQFD